MYRLTPLADRLPPSVPFVGPETQERAMGQAFRARLGANESVFGPSPKAVEAMAEAAGQTWMYGDPEVFDLRQALAVHHGVQADRIMVGEGIDGLLGYLVRLLVAEGDVVVTSSGAYPTFNYHVTGFGGQLEMVPYRDDREDPDALLEAVKRTGARLVYLANPDNPMGTWLSAAEIEGFARALPAECVLCLDEAYSDFAPEGAVPAELPENVIRMRTFSKAYGLAGLRVGYCLGAPDLIAAFNRVRNHFGVGRVAQAGAMAALADQDWLTRVLEDVAAARVRIAEIATKHGLVALPSATNFVTLDCGRDGDHARALLAELVARGVFVRMPFVAPQDRCIRVTAAPDRDLDVFAEVLPEALKALG